MESQANVVTRRLHFLKCTRCRSDKKQCLPLERVWPRQKCNRCSKYNYACSASMTAKQQRQSSALEILTRSGIPNEELREAETIHYRIEELPAIRSGTQPDGSFVPPKCAVLFDNLMRAHWDYFGIRADDPTIYDIRLKFILDVETSAVYHTLMFRLALLDLYRDYSEAVSQGKSSGMTELASQAFASRKVLLELSKAMDPGKTDVDRFIQEFDERIKFASRVKSLVDAIGVLEVLLISYEESDIDDNAEIPLLDFVDLSDTEWTCLLSRLLAPSLEIKETCFKLSGVVNMIQQLKGMKESDIRSFLVGDIRRRVKGVFGDDDASDGDESMADIDPMTA